MKIEYKSIIDKAVAQLDEQLKAPPQKEDATQTTVAGEEEEE